MVGETIKVNIPKPSHIETNGIKLHVMQAGYSEGEPVVLLHGFPEFWYGWHRQIAPLAEAGYRLIIPDQRGYNLSDKPEGVEAYRIENLMADIIGLMDALGHEKVRLVGHDWGAAVAWSLAIQYPERFKQLVIMNVPHPGVFMKFVRTNPEQMLKSWYIGMFQIPAFPEQMLKLTNYAQFANIMREQAGLKDDEVRRYKEAWSQTNAMTGMINWYRALGRYRPEPPTDERVHVPTMMIWGMQDFALSHKMAEPSINMCDEGKLVLIKEASHFVQHDKAARVNELLLEFFGDESNPSQSDQT